MAKSDTTRVSYSFGGVWLVAFLILKYAGAAPLAAWSLWWMFLPFVPVLAFIFQKLGWI